MKDTLCSPESEAYVIGCLLRAPGRTLAIVDRAGCDESWFIDENHSLIFRAAIDLRAAGVTIDEASIIGKMKDNGDHLFVGDMCLQSAKDISGKMDNTLHHVGVLGEKKKERNLDTMLGRARKRVGGAERASDIASGLRADLTGISIRINDEKTPEKCVDEIYERMSKARITGYSGIKTRWEPLNRVIGSYELGQMSMLGARPKRAKTMMMCNDGLHKAKTGEGFYMQSTEMPEPQVRMRLAACELGVDAFMYMNGRVSKEEIDVFADCMREQLKLPFAVADGPATIKTICSRMQDVKGEFRFVGIDHANRISRAHDDPKNRVEQLSLYSKMISNTALKTGIATLVLCQLSRGAEWDYVKRRRKLPTMDDIKGAGDWEEDAFLIMALAKNIELAIDEEWEDNLPLTLRVCAHRAGPVGDVPFIFEKTRNRLVVDDARVYKDQQNSGDEF